MEVVCRKEPHGVVVAGVFGSKFGGGPLLRLWV